MDRISTSTKATDLFGPGKHGWRNGNLAGGTAPTDFNAEWFNGAQEEPIGVIEGAGLVPTAGDYTQLRKAIDVMIRKAAGATAVAGGTADAITAAFVPVVAALVSGMIVYVRTANPNTAAAPTFTADGTAAKAIVKGNGQALVAGDIAGGGHWIELQYDVTLDKWLLLNPANGVNALGSGQNAQNVLASRAWNTTYTNTTTKPIFVSVSASVLTAGAAPILTVGGVQYYGTSVYDVNVGHVGAVVAIVPPGITYSLSVSLGSPGTLATWTELR
jgi:hypothetical protein